MNYKYLTAAVLAASLGSTAQAAIFSIDGVQTGASPGVVYSPTPTFQGTLLDYSHVDNSFQWGWFHFFSSYTFDTGTAVYKTSTITHTRISPTGPGVVSGNVVTFTDLTTTDYLSRPSCTGSCVPIPSNVTGVNGLMDLVITFSNPLSFTAVASVTYTDVLPGLTRTFAFSGTDVPVPATAWLFGSALIGLAGSKLRRSRLR